MQNIILKKMKTVNFIILKKGAIMPSYKTVGSSGADLCACIDANITIKPNEIVSVPTGIIVEPPEGFEVQIRPRSGLALKNGITIPNSPGTIDNDYRGELIVILQNLGKNDFMVENGMRIAQIVIAPYFQFEFKEVDKLSDTERGSNGFGSTGLK
jgi:dUTP pyrophosphatase